MSNDEGDVAVVVEEEVSITVVSEPVAPPARTQGSSWAGFWIMSALVVVLGVVLFWLPGCYCPFSSRLITAQRQDKLWGVSTNDTIAPVGGDVCRRVSGRQR